MLHAKDGRAWRFVVVRLGLLLRDGLFARHARYIKTLIEAGRLKVVIDRRYPLEAIVEARRFAEQGTSGAMW